MKARNKIIAGAYKEYHFNYKHGMIYHKCLDLEFSFNQMTIKSVTLLDYYDTPNLLSMIIRGKLLSIALIDLGMIAGVMSAKHNSTYKLNITFADSTQGVAEVDEKIYEKILDLLLQYQ